MKLTEGTVKIKTSKDLIDMTMAEVMQIHFTNVLKECDYNISEAARRLKISRATAWRKQCDYGIKRPAEYA